MYEIGRFGCSKTWLNLPFYFEMSALSQEHICLFHFSSLSLILPGRLILFTFPVSDYEFSSFVIPLFSYWIWFSRLIPH